MNTKKSSVRSERGCLAWGGTAGLAPVDDILISVKRPLASTPWDRWPTSTSRAMIEKDTGFVIGDAQDIEADTANA